MYQFRIKKQDDGRYRFELDGIKLIVDSYSIKENKHFLDNPTKAIAYFNIDEHVYGVSNEPLNFATAEAFFDAIKKQYQVFTETRTHHIVKLSPPATQVFEQNNLHSA